MRALLASIFYMWLHLLFGLGSGSGCARGGLEGDGAPTVVSVTPSSGPKSGGTPVLVRGSGFGQGLRVFVGVQEATSVVWSSPTEARAVTPSSAFEGELDVVVEDAAGRRGVLERGFRYDPERRPVIEAATILNDATVEDQSGAARVLVRVRAAVRAKGATDAIGQGPSIRAQVGVATRPLTEPISQADFAWLPASYQGDSTDGLEDLYAGELEVDGPRGSEARAYVVAARFTSEDSGGWLLADRDGSANGVSLDQLPVVLVRDVEIDECRLGSDAPAPAPAIGLSASDTGRPVVAQVIVEGVTTRPGRATSIKGQLGYGPHGTAPESWTWLDATYEADAADGRADQYGALLPNPGPGEYDYAFRFLSTGGTERRCDANGGSFESSQLGRLIVGRPFVEHCRIQQPATLTTVPSAPTRPVFTRVLVAGVTDAAGPGEGVVVELGVGPLSTTPWSDAWAWVTATYDSDQEVQRLDQYAQRVGGRPAGEYDVAARARHGDAPWIYCDLDGSQNGYQPSLATKLTVGPQTLQSCRLASASTALVPSGEVVTVLGRVSIPGVTDAAGPAAGLRAQVGLGPRFLSAVSQPGWAWQDAPYRGDVPPGDDEFKADVRCAYTGDRALSFRVTQDDGATWTYCDLNGSDVGGYTTDQQLALTVSSHRDLDWCNLQWPPRLTPPTDGGVAMVFGRLYEPGVTPSATAPIEAELGVGPQDLDPGVGWRGVSASFNVSFGNDNEYAAPWAPTLAGPTDTRYAFRFRRAGGDAYCYGDLSGGGGGRGFTPDQLGDLATPATAAVSSLPHPARRP